MRAIHKILLLSVVLLWKSETVIAALAPEPVTEQIQLSNPAAEIRITTKGTTVRIQNATGTTLEIYNITGLKIAAYKIDSNDKTITITNGKGCYILKLGKIARKISIL